jgi:hypothetical protein
MCWFDDIQDDFVARADWLVAENFEDANHNPKHEIKEGLDLAVDKGEEVTLHRKSD